VQERSSRTDENVQQPELVSAWTASSSGLEHWLKHISVAESIVARIILSRARARPARGAGEVVAQERDHAPESSRK